MRYCGHPLIGDFLYHPNPGDSGMKRQALHAGNLTFYHPVTGEKRKSYMVVHDATRKQLEILLHMLAEKGEEETFAYIRQHILRKKKAPAFLRLLRNVHRE